jgi:hypothetical protein
MSGVDCSTRSLGKMQDKVDQNEYDVGILQKLALAVDADN